MNREPLSVELCEEKDEFLELWGAFAADGVIDVLEIAQLTPRLERKSALIEQINDGNKVAMAAMRGGPLPRRTQRMMRDYDEAYNEHCLIG